MIAKRKNLVAAAMVVAVIVISLFILQSDTYAATVSISKGAGEIHTTTYSGKKGDKKNPPRVVMGTDVAYIAYNWAGKTKKGAIPSKATITKYKKKAQDYANKYCKKTFTFKFKLYKQSNAKWKEIKTITMSRKVPKIEVSTYVLHSGSQYIYTIMGSGLFSNGSDEAWLTKNFSDLSAGKYKIKKVSANYPYSDLGSTFTVK